MSFSLSVYTVYFCCAAIPPVPPGQTDNLPAAEPHCGAGGPAHADAAAKPLEEVKISTALPIACSRFSLSFYIRFKCSHHDHAFEVMFCFRLTVAFHNLIICSVHWLPGATCPSSGTREMCSSASGPLVILMTTKSFVSKCACVRACVRAGVCVCVHLCEGSLHVRHLTQFIERVFHNYNNTYVNAK